MKLHEQALTRILLLQNMISLFDNQESILNFVCRGMEEIPGVVTATYLSDSANNSTDQLNAYFPLQLNDSFYGGIYLSLSSQDDFKPYESYIHNLCFMIVVILEERRQTQLINQHQELLERQVSERTKELKIEIHERRMAEKKALRAKKRSELFLDISEAIIVELDRLGKIRVINKRGCEILKQKQADLIGKDWIELFTPSHIQPALKNIFNKAMEGQDGIDEYFENELISSDGELHYIFWHNVLQFDDQGQISGVLCAGIDITKRKQAEEDKLKLEKQLQQAQRIESIGHLAGGVAHDFNNMLGVILGHTELALMKADPDNPFVEDLEQIHTAAKRSADLTRQLLTFARKETIAPQNLDLNEAVAGMLTILQRLIGENIQLGWNPAADLWAIKMDSAQLDQILTNLCINARDATDDIGTITIDTRNCSLSQRELTAHPEAQPGDYVQLSVSDDGHGMDKATLSQIFEPFFTTKEFGQGTGLGLATVYGAVKQNQGFIEVSSEPGQGTTFRIYLPRNQATAPAAPVTTTKPLRQGSETILLVEDDQMLLKLVQTMLEESGYTVLSTATTDLAISLAKGHEGPIHLLLSDLVMPEMNGRDLREKLQTIRPEMKVIFMSGYTADIIAKQGVIEEEVHFLQKPISFELLTSKVREVLDAAP